MEYNETTMVQYMIYIYTMVLHIIITQDYIKKYHATMVFGHVPWYYHGILRTTMSIYCTIAHGIIFSAMVFKVIVLFLNLLWQYQALEYHVNTLVYECGNHT